MMTEIDLRNGEWKRSAQGYYSWVDLAGNEILRDEWLTAVSEQERELRPGITRDELLAAVARRDYWYNETTRNSGESTTAQSPLSTQQLATQAECDRIRLAAEAKLKRDYEHGLAVHLAELFQSRRSP